MAGSELSLILATLPLLTYLKCLCSAWWRRFKCLIRFVVTNIFVPPSGLAYLHSLRGASMLIAWQSWHVAVSMLVQMCICLGLSVHSLCSLSSAELLVVINSNSEHVADIL